MPALGSWSTSAIELATCFRFWRNPALTSLKNSGCSSARKRRLVAHLEDDHGGLDLGRRDEDLRRDGERQPRLGEELRGDAEHAHVRGLGGEAVGDLLLQHDGEAARFARLLEQMAEDGGAGGIGEVGDDVERLARRDELVGGERQGIARHQLEPGNVAERGFPGGRSTSDRARRRRRAAPCAAAPR